ncbi:glucosamine 6-phosphate N-acetyltransferase [Oratosquilla oratoria]|uniref:glucosamine 6-phosphate N-acetyltransferase n=1 Tax=Oratosquilla oratoria TaxID=337810 RepID=UPI003F76E9DD
MGAPDITVPPSTPDNDIPLYDPKLLAELDWSKVSYMKDGVTSNQPGHGLKVRPLRRGDYDRGFLKLLEQLTKVGDISREQFEKRFEIMRQNKDHYYVTVIEDLNTGEIVASATLAVEFKFIRNCTKRARLEDVVVSPDYRGKQLGKLIVTTITLLARLIGCYKIGLDCKDAMKGFYGSMGYGCEEGNANAMIIRF